MKEEMKFYLLAEKSGWNLQKYAIDYGKSLKETENYRTLANNINNAKDHLSFKARGLIESFDRLQFYTLNIKDCFILESSFDYLLLHSYPEYYINPLAIDPNYHGEINSIGELIFDFDGEDLTLNEIILDDTKSQEYKMERIEPQLEYYLSDMIKIADASIVDLKKQAINKTNFMSITFNILEILFFIFANVFLFVTWINPFEIFFDHFYNPVLTHVLTYLAYMYPLIIFLYDLSFIAFHIYRANVSESYNYAKRFLQKNTEKLFEDIGKRKEELKNYIEGAIYAKISLKNDIKDFSCLSESYVDLKAVMDYDKIKDRKLYRVLNALRFSLTTIAALSFVIFCIVYIIALVFKVSI